MKTAAVASPRQLESQGLVRVAIPLTLSLALATLVGCASQTPCDEDSATVASASATVGYVQPAWMADLLQEEQEQAVALTRCLADDGWTVVVRRGGFEWPEGPLSEDQESAFAEARRDCLPDRASDEVAGSRFTADEWRVQYAHALDTRDCLVWQGYEVSDPPTEEEWVEEGTRFDTVIWTPWKDVIDQVMNGAIRMDDEAYYDLFDLCIQDAGGIAGPPSLVQGWMYTQMLTGEYACEEGEVVMTTAKASRRVLAQAGDGVDMGGGFFGPYSATVRADQASADWAASGSDELLNPDDVSGCSPASSGSRQVSRSAGTAFSEPAWMEDARQTQVGFTKDLKGCLAESGWEITVDPDGTYWPTQVLSKDDMDALHNADMDCHVKWVGISDPPTEENWRVKYARAVDTAACLTAEGYEITNPPSEDEWVEEAMADGYPGWVPFEQVLDQVMTGDIAMDADTYYDLYATCTQGGPTVTMDW